MITYYTQQAGQCIVTCLSSDAKPVSPPDDWLLMELDSPRRYRSTGGAWLQANTANWGDIEGAISTQTDLQSALAAKAFTSTLAGVTTSGAYGSLSGTPTLGTAASTASSTYAMVSTYVYQAQIGTVASTAASTYPFASTMGTAASTAAANYASSTHRHDASHITSGTMATARLGSGTADGTTFLRGDQTYAVPGGGSDPWTYLRVTSDVWVSTSASTVAIPGLSFTPAVSTRYEIEAQMKFRTSTAGAGPRPALVWPTNAIGGVATLWLTSAVGTQVLTNGNIATTTIQIPVGGLPDTTGWWPGQLMACYQSSSNTSGNILIRMGSETSSTWVGIQRDSFMKYRTYT